MPYSFLQQQHFGIAEPIVRIQLNCIYFILQCISILIPCRPLISIHSLLLNYIFQYHDLTTVQVINGNFYMVGLSILITDFYGKQTPVLETTNKSLLQR